MSFFIILALRSHSLSFDTRSKNRGESEILLSPAISGFPRLDSLLKMANCGSFHCMIFG